MTAELEVSADHARAALKLRVTTMIGVREYLLERNAHPTEAQALAIAAEVGPIIDRLVTEAGIDDEGCDVEGLVERSLAAAIGVAAVVMRLVPRKSFTDRN